MLRAISAAAIALMLGAAAVAQQKPVEVVPPNSNLADPNRSRDLAKAEVSPMPEHVIELRPGAQTVIRLSRPFSSISVGNPTVVDVLPRSDRVFTIMGKKVGTADIIIYDNSVDIYRMTATVGAPREGGRIMAHDKANLHQWNTYECTPVCVLVKDELEGPAATAPIIIESRGHVSTQVVVPPAVAPR